MPSCWDISLPEEWSCGGISSVCIKTKTRDPSKYPDDEFEYVDVSSVSNESFTITSSTATLGIDAPSRARKAIETDDVLYATVRPYLKRVAKVPSSLNGQIASTGFCVIRADKKKASPAFLYYLLLTEKVNARIKDLQRGSSYPAVSDKEVVGQMVPLPPLPEQRSIAATLSKIQEAIATQQEIIDRTREMKKALMVKLFTEGLSGEPTKKTEIGLMPESWDVTPLAECIDIKHGYAFKGKYFVDDGPVVLTPGNFNTDGGLYWGHKTKYTEESFPSDYIFNAGDLVVVMTDLTPSGRLLGIPAFIPSGKVILHNQRIGKVIVLNNKLNVNYLYNLLLTENFRSYMFSTATGSIVKHTSPSRIKNYMVGLPKLEEQKEIASCLDSFDDKLKAAFEKYEPLNNAFKTMLHELMTGNIRTTSLMEA